ncbi:DDE superfamily endonuclease [Popillia japonica]|uniref:DDE superfamily endonuclease n=1 Tax=Popillia japonica TaxID=7064 RepID=A0AAW1MDZ9_POPJA
MAFSDFCKENSIELVALYPNATQILQPMDVTVFHPLKESWKKAVYSFRIRNAGLPLKRDNFCPILREALTNITSDILKNGFRRCGLCPFDANALDYKQLPTGGQNLTNETRPSNLKILEHLVFFEQNIPPEKLYQFKAAGETWIGALEDNSLFYF